MSDVRSAQPALNPLRVRLVLAALLLAVWLPARNACFFWDDEQLVVDNDLLAHGDVLGILSGGLFAAHGDAAVTYHRPLTLLSLCVDRALFGLSPAGYHIDNVLLHLAVVVCLHALVSRRAKPAVAAAVAICAGLHPALSEAVLWVSARGDLLATLVILGGLIAMDSDSRRTPVALFLLAWVAPLCKEIGYLLPVFALGWRTAQGGRVRRPEAVALALGCGLALLMRWLAHIGVPSPGDDPVYSAAEVAARAAVFAAAWTTVPWPLTSSTSVHTLFTPAVALGAVATLALVTLIAVRAGPPARILLALGGLAWVPATFAMMRTGLYGERYLYLPMMFLLLALAHAASDGRRILAAVMALALPAVVALGVRMADWTSAVSLIEAAAARQPCGVALLHLAQQRESEGRTDEALTLYDRLLDEERPVLAACASAVRLRREAGDPAGAAAAIPHLEALGCGTRAAFIAETRTR